MVWQSRLASEGLRVTEPRRAVMQVLSEATAPMSPRDIWTQGRQIHAHLGLVTVYRTLALMESLHCVRRVHHEECCTGYLVCSPGHSHTLICRRCGRATDFAGADDLCALIARVELDTGYRVDGHLLQLMGLCPRCKERKVPVS